MQVPSQANGVLRTVCKTLRREYKNVQGSSYPWKIVQSLLL